MQKRAKKETLKIQKYVSILLIRPIFETRAEILKIFSFVYWEI